MTCCDKCGDYNSKCGCHDCGTYEDQVTYQAWCGVTITSPEDGVVIIQWEKSSTVVSGNDCILVNPTQQTDADWCTYTQYELTVVKEDEKVKIFESCDNAVYLNEAITSTSPITVNATCDGVDIGIDEDLLTHPTYRDCDWDTINEWATLLTPNQLRDSIQLGEGLVWRDGPWKNANEIADPAWCDSAWIQRDCWDECSCERQWVVQLRMTRDAFVEPAIGWGGYYILVNTSNPENLWTDLPDSAESVWADSVDDLWWKKELDYGPLLWWEGWLICNNCPIPRVVDADFQATIEASWGVNGLRAQMFKTCSDGSVVPVSERRDSPISDQDEDGDWLPDNYIISSQWGLTNGIGQGYKYQERQTINMSSAFVLEPDCCVYVVFKVSTTIGDPNYDVDAFPNAQASILGQTGIVDVSHVWDFGWSLTVKTIDDCCMIEEVTDECDCASGLTYDPITGSPLWTSTPCYDDTGQEVPCISVG